MDTYDIKITMNSGLIINRTATRYTKDEEWFTVVSEYGEKTIIPRQNIFIVDIKPINHPGGE